MINKLNKYKFLLFFLLILAVIFFIGEKALNSSSTSSTSQTNNTGSTEQVQKSTLTKSISVSGTIQTANFLSITTSVNGIVKQVFVKEGALVSKGQKIMEITLDSEGEKSLQSAYANLLRAQNSLNEIKNSLKQLENSVIQKESAFETVKKTTSYSNETERNAFKIAENDYLKAKSDLELQKSQIAQAEISYNSDSLDYQAQSPIITSPSDGVISNIVAVEGSKIENSVTSDRSVKTVASIKLTGTPIAQLNVTEMDVANIKVGQKVNLTLTSNDTKKFEGTVVGIDKVGTVSSGVSNYPVIIKFNKDDESILPNMSVSAEIIIDQKADVVNIPTTAIEQNNEIKFVTVIDNGQQRTKQIETGFVGNSNTEITKGLTEGETVLIGTLPTSGFTSTSTNNRRTPGIFGIFGGR